jgi:hypothetical protein
VNCKNAEQKSPPKIPDIQFVILSHWNCLARAGNQSSEDSMTVWDSNIALFPKWAGNLSTLPSFDIIVPYA